MDSIIGIVFSYYYHFSSVIFVPHRGSSLKTSRSAFSASIIDYYPAQTSDSLIFSLKL